ncbi:MAG: hypothetical protein WA021_02080 [Minisyncoccia bacterium]
MDEKKVIAVLTNLLKTHELSDDEKEALRTAIGTLAWTKLAEGYIEGRKKARDRKLKDLE